MTVGIKANGTHRAPLQKNGNRLRNNHVKLMRRSCLLAALIAFPFIGQASNKDGQKPPILKDWPGSDVSLTLQNKGKRTEAERKLTECKSDADSLFRQKRYEEAARGYQKC